MKTLLRNCMVWDGSGTAPYPAEVLVEGERIRRVARGGTLPAEDAEVLDGLGMTLMPGLVEGHAHLSFCGATRNTDLGDIPPEEHTIETLLNAKKLLDAGFTSAYSAASAKLRLDVVVRNEVNSGRSPGPRIRAASPEITVTGGLGDENRQHMMRDSFGIVVDGPEAIARAVRTCIREGVDNIKLNISGDDFVPAKGARRRPHATRRTGCVSFSGTSSAFISARLMMPSDSATSAIVPPLASAVLAISAAFS